MKSSTSVLVVLYEGRYFVKKPGSKIYIQCKFNSEILTTNPAPFENSPIWDTELAWELDTKALSYLRSQRATLKLIIHSIDSQNRRDTLGYIMLDLRGASQKVPAPEKWYPLINSKQGNTFRPEVKLSFSVSPTSEILTTTTTSTASRQSKQHAQNKQTISIPYEFGDDGYYQIKSGKSTYHFTLTLAFAENLSLLVDHATTHIPTNSLTNGYHFFMKVLNSEFATTQFHDLDNPIFSTERFIIRFKSTRPDLINFIRELSRCTLYLYHGNQILGYTYIPFSPLIQGGLSHDFPIVENVYNIFNSKEELPMSHDSRVPNVGLSLSISRQDIVQVPVASSASPTGTQSKTIKDQRVPSPVIAVQNNDPYLSTSPRIPTSAYNSPVPQAPPSPAARESPLTPRRNDQFDDEPLPAPSRIPTWKPTDNPQKEVVVDPLNWRQYRFSIDFLEVRDFRLEDTEIYMRYAYAPFGTTSNITNAPTSISSKGPTQLPHSFSAFEFIMSYERLQTYLEGVPLLVEVWTTKDLKGDACLGSATVDLAMVLQSPRVQATQETKGCFIQSSETLAMVSGAEAYDFQKICDLRMSLALEDFGVVEDGSKFDNLQMDDTSIQPQSPIRDYFDGQTTPFLSAGMKEEASTTPFRPAVDFDMWKQQEEKRFKEALVEKEKTLLTSLSEEWAKRDKEREQILKTKVEDFQNLELQMQKLLLDLEERERQLVINEDMLVRKREDLEREHKRRLEEARDAARRLHEEYKHQVEFQKKKALEAINDAEKAMQDKRDLEIRCKELQQEANDARVAMTKTPEATLKVELLQVKEELALSRKSLESAEKSKKNYKSQLAKALKDLSAVKKDHQMEAEETLIKEKRNIEAMKLEQFVKETAPSSKSSGSKKEVTKEDDRILAEIKRELDELKQNSLVRMDKEAKKEKASASYTSEELRENYPPEAVTEIERLQRERSSLLCSGAYTKNDYIITELDRRIKIKLGGD